MKAIISNGRRNQIFSNQLDLNELANFISVQFPNMKKPKMTYKNLEGDIQNINSKEDLQALKKIYGGQNFVQISISRGNHEQKHNNLIQKKQKKINVLSHVYGGQPKDYQKFVEENIELPVGKIIKKYSQAHQINKFSNNPRNHNLQRKNKILNKIFGQNSNIELTEQFIQKNKDLTLGQIIKSFRKQNQGNIDNIEKKKQHKLEKLSTFLEKPKEEFVQLVSSNPDLNVRQLLKILQGQGVQFDIQKFKKFNEQFKCQKQKERILNKEKSRKKSNQKSKSNSKSQEKKLKKQLKDVEKQEQYIELKEQKSESHQKNEKANKGQILKAMKQIYGADNVKEYVKFINQNINLGKQAIIQKWFEEQ